jgi:pimeloyl-ACP methyl ester carboxylesterase
MKLLLTILFALPLFSTAQETPLPAKENFHLYLLVGQSNMAGRGTVTESDRKPDPRVLMLNSEGLWVAAVDPLHFDKPAVVGVGLGRTFALAVADADPGVTIGLIPCAVGGSPIDSWMPGALDKATNTHPWDDAMKRAHLALSSGTLKGILWHQGESDSKSGLAAAYEAKLISLVERFRQELHAPEVPFLAGQMGIFPESPWTPDKSLVDQAHQNLEKTVKNAAFVSAEGLHHKGDKVHFDAESYRELGRRFAVRYLEMVK